MCKTGKINITSLSDDYKKPISHAFYVPTNTKSEIRTNEEIIKLCIFEFQMKMVLGVDL